MKRVLLLVLGLLLAVLALAQEAPRGPREVFQQFIDASAVGDRRIMEVLFREKPTLAQLEAMADLLEGRVVNIEFIPDELDDSRWVLTPVLNLRGEETGLIEVERSSIGSWRFSERTRRGLERMAGAHRERAAFALKDWTKGEAKGPDALANPRRAMEGFFRAAQAGRWVEASALLDLQDIPAVSRPIEGGRLSRQLLAILNRLEIVPLDVIPEGSEGPPFAVARVPGVGSLELDRSQDGGWRMTPASLRLMDSLWREVRDRPILGGRRGVGEEEFDPGAGIRRAAPPALRTQVLWVEAWQWGVMGALLLLAVLLGLTVWWAARLVLRRIDRSDPPLIGLARRKQVSRALGIGAGLVLLHQTKALADLPTLAAGVADFVLNAGVAVSVVAMLWGIWAAFCDWSAAGLEARSPRLRNLFLPVAHRFGQAVIALSMLVFVLSRLGVDASALVAGLGLGGLVLGLAAKDTVENFIGSALILFERPFAIGDWVKVGDAEGTVEDITLRSTRIRTFHDSVVTLPNGRLVAGQVENLGKRRKIRVKMTLSFSGDSDPEALRGFLARLSEALSDWEPVQADGRVLKLTDMSPTGPTALFLFFLDPIPFAEEVQLKEEVILKALALAREEGISLGVER